MAHVHIKKRGAMRPLGASSVKGVTLCFGISLTSIMVTHYLEQRILGKKVQLALFLALMTQLTCDADAMTSCCTRKPHPCALYELLCRAGHRNLTDPDGKLGRLSSDAAAGILTLGKRKATETRYQDRLQHLLHSSRNQAAGILTMGKRGVESGLGTDHTSVQLNLERPLKYLIQPVDRDSYGQ